MRSTPWAAGAATVLLAATLAAAPPAADDLADTLQRAGERVARLLARAQSLVCLETVRLQPLGLGLSPQGRARVVESELRLAWDEAPPAAPASETRQLRQVLRVNGHAPRARDPHNCTAAEQHATEPQPLSLLLPAERQNYAFSPAGRGTVDGRPALMIDYVMREETTVSVDLVEGNDNCVSFAIDGGMRGRIWIDAETYDVVRIDQRLKGLVEIPMPPRVLERTRPRDAWWTVERMDTTIRFRRVTFADPDETLTLPISISELRVTRGSGTPRLRTSTEYSGYQRFLTGVRVVP